MCIKIIYNITTFKNVFQYQMAKFKNAKLKLLLHQANIYNHEVGKWYNHQIGKSFVSLLVVRTFSFVPSDYTCFLSIRYYLFMLIFLNMPYFFMVQMFLYSRCFYLIFITPPSWIYWLEVIYINGFQWWTVYKFCGADITTSIFQIRKLRLRMITLPD